uniref:Mitochondrial import inner membrane translocase subunit Tim21 n=1 Tax=Paramoeba aestuarina TaxID=180227 RepID=A0A7S4L5V5_9EUKA
MSFLSTWGVSGGRVVGSFVVRRACEPVVCLSPSLLSSSSSSPLHSSSSLRASSSLCLSSSSSLRAVSPTSLLHNREFSSTTANWAEARKRAVEKAKEGKQGESRVVFVKALEKGKEAGFSIAFIGCIGFLVLCVGYKGLWNGMLSPNSTVSLFRKASKICKKDSDVQEIFGTPVNTSGEGHRGYLIQEEMVAGKDGQMRRVIAFNISGPKENGNVYAQFVQDGWWWKIEHLRVISSRYSMFLVKDGKETSSAAEQ